MGDHKNRKTKPPAAMKFLLPLFALPLLSCDESSPESKNDQGSSSLEKSKPTPGSALSSTADQPTESNQKRTISKRIPKGKWDPEKPGQVISPDSGESFLVVGAVGGEKIKDPSGNELIVPNYQDAPVKIYPIAQPAPDRPGYALNPFTKTEVDLRGVPGGSLVRDPNDPDPDHKFRVPKP